jgi:hypothetical protein
MSTANDLAPAETPGPRRAFVALFVLRCGMLRTLFLAAATGLAYGSPG